MSSFVILQLPLYITLTPLAKTLMSSRTENSRLVFQEFESKNGEPLLSLLTSVSSSGSRHVLWSDIQDAFEGIDHLTYYGMRILFETDDNFEV